MRQSQCSSHPRFGAKGSDQQETPSQVHTGAIWHWKGKFSNYGTGRVGFQMSNFLFFIFFQTSVSLALCHEETRRYGRKNVIYICFSKNSQGRELKLNFKKELQVGEEISVETFSRQESLEKFGFENSSDNIAAIEGIIENLPDLPRLALFAIRDIVKGEQLTFDYRQRPGADDSMESIQRGEEAGMECKCGSSNCRKVMFH